MGGIRSIAVLAIALVAASVLVACGGSGSDKSASAGAATQSSPDESSAQSKAAQENISDVNGSAVGVPPLKISNGGAEQFKVTKGGSKNYLEFGREGSHSELVAAAEALRAYFIVRAEEKWKEACSFLSKETVRGIKSLAASPAETCGETLDSLTAPLSKSKARKSTIVEAGSLRRDPEVGAYLLYYGPNRTVYSMPMTREDGVWKVAGPGATVLY